MRGFYTAEECLALAEKFSVLAQCERDDAKHFAEIGLIGTAEMYARRAQLNEEKALKWSRLAEERAA